MASNVKSKSHFTSGLTSQFERSTEYQPCRIPPCISAHTSSSSPHSLPSPPWTRSLTGRRVSWRDKRSKKKDAESVRSHNSPLTGAATRADTGPKSYRQGERQDVQRVLQPVHRLQEQQAAQQERVRQVRGLQAGLPGRALATCIIGGVVR